MKFSFLLPILYLTWTAQAYAGHELAHSPTYLLTRDIEERLDGIGQNVFGRSLAPVRKYTPSAPGLTSRQSQSSFVKRASPSGSPRHRNSPDPGDTHWQGVLRKLGAKSSRATLMGVAGSSAMLAINSVTDWHSPQHAVPAAVGMACVGTITLAGMCAHVDVRKRYGQLRNSVSSALQAHHGTRAGSSLELQPVLPAQGPSRTLSPPRSDDPSDLVRRFLDTAKIIRTE